MLVIDQLHRSLKEFIKKICSYVMLYVVVASINQCCATFKLIPWIKYTGYANFASDIGKATIFCVSWHLFEANWTY